MSSAKMMVKVLATTFVVGACSHGPRSPAPSEVPETTNVMGGAFTSGISIGRLHGQKQLEGFIITKYPITVGRYRQCISAGACTPPKLQTLACTQAFQAPATRVDRATFAGGDDNLPVTCVTVPQAEEYCQWQGGSLPTGDQWLMATRGGSPMRHAWGNDTASCDRHPGGKQLSPSGQPVPCTPTTTDFEIAKHPNGASPFGVQDVLLTTGELTSTQSGSLFGACSAGECIAQGVFAGSIDGFSSAAKDPAPPNPAQTTYGFRCILPEASQ